MCTFCGDSAPKLKCGSASPKLSEALRGSQRGLSPLTAPSLSQALGCLYFFLMYVANTTQHYTFSRLWLTFLAYVIYLFLMKSDPDQAQVSWPNSHHPPGSCSTESPLLLPSLHTISKSLHTGVVSSIQSLWLIGIKKLMAGSRDSVHFKFNIPILGWISNFMKHGDHSKNYISLFRFEITK